MKRGAVIAAMAVLLSAPAWAGTYYAYAPVKDSIFAIDPSTITVNGNVRSATIYYVHPWGLAEASELDVDCVSQMVTTKSRKMVRPDLSVVRNIKVEGPSSTPDPKTTGGITRKLVCDWPKAPEKTIKMEAASTAEFVARLSDSIRKSAKQTAGMVIDQTSVGDCIFRKIPQPVSYSALTLIQQGKSPGEDQQVRAEVDKAADACGVAPGDKEIAVFAAQAVYGRFGVMTIIPEKGKLREDILAAAWNGADASVREPFLALAALAMSPGSTVAEITSRRDALIEPGNTLAANPELKAAVAKVSKRKPEEIAGLLRQYFAAMAMGEVAEAKLAPQ